MTSIALSLADGLLHACTQHWTSFRGCSFPWLFVIQQQCVCPALKVITTKLPCQCTASPSLSSDRSLAPLLLELAASGFGPRLSTSPLRLKLKSRRARYTCAPLTVLQGDSVHWDLDLFSKLARCTFCTVMAANKMKTSSLSAQDRSGSELMQGGLLKRYKAIAHAKQVSWGAQVLLSPSAGLGLLTLDI